MSIFMIGIDHNMAPVDVRRSWDLRVYYSVDL